MPNDTAPARQGHTNTVPPHSMRAGSPRTRAPRRWLALAAGALLLTVTACASEPEAPTETTTPPTTSTSPTSPTPGVTVPTPTHTPVPEFDTSAHSIDDPMSPWVVTNKLRPLNPNNFQPTDLVMPEGVANEWGQPLREPAARAAEALIGAAAAAGHDVWIISAFRDYNTQVALYYSYVDRDGQAAADTYSARPGHSEHQTGLVIDLDDYGACYLQSCFGDTAAGVWLAEHAAEHGFILRYPAGKEAITGFMAEPWHFRYVGIELAQEMKRTNTLTLEEFFGLEAAPDYAE